MLTHYLGLLTMICSDLGVGERDVLCILKLIKMSYDLLPVDRALLDMPLLVFKNAYCRLTISDNVIHHYDILRVRLHKTTILHPVHTETNIVFKSP